MAGLWFSVNGPLDRPQEVKLALNLVKGHRVGAADERLRVVARAILNVQVVQGEVAPLAWGKSLTPCALPGLLRSRQHDGGHDLEPFG